MKAKKLERAPERWAILWRSENKSDGVSEWFMWEDCRPLLFQSRREARDFVESRFAYIKTRPDLRAEPHGWKLPRPVRVLVNLTEVPESSRVARKDGR